MPIVNVPGVGQVRFPDDMSQDDIVNAIENDILKKISKEIGVSDYVKDIPKALGRGAVGLLETSGIGASALLPEEYEKKARAGIKQLANPAKEYLAPATPELGESVSSKLTSGLGSTLPFFLAGPMGIAGRVATTALGVSAGAGEARQNAEQAGVTGSDRGLATLLGAPVGLLDKIAPQIGPLKSLFSTALARGGVEGLTEAAQKVAQNYIAKGIYNPNQDVLEGSGEEGAYGAGVGALASLLVDLTLGRKARGKNIPPPSQKEIGGEDKGLPTPMETLPLPNISAPPQGMDANRALAMRKEAIQADQQRRLAQQEAEEQRMASAQERARSMQGFATPAGGNLQMMGQVRADQQAAVKQQQREQVAAEKARQKQIQDQINEINNTTYSTDPVANQITKQRLLEQFAQQQPQPQVIEEAPPEVTPVKPTAMSQMAGFASPATTNQEMLGATRKRQADEIKAAETAKKKRIKEIQNTVYSPDPLANELAKRKILEQEGLVEPAKKEAKPAEVLVDENLEPPLGPVAYENIPGQKAKAPIDQETKEEDRLNIKALKEQEKEIRSQIFQAKRSGTNLRRILAGRLDQSEISEFGDKNSDADKKLISNTGGASLDDIVSDGLLNEFLPIELHRGTDVEANEVAEESADKSFRATEYIRNLLQTNQNMPFQSQQIIRQANLRHDEVLRLIDRYLSTEEINILIQEAIDEQARIDQAAGEAATEGETGTAGRGEETAGTEEVSKEKPKKQAPAETPAEQPPELKPPEGFKAKEGRNEQVVLAARELQAGRITKEQYDKYVDAYMPIGTIPNPEPPMSQSDMRDVLQKNQLPKINVPIADGTPVGLRMDINALKRSKARGLTGSVVAIHPENDPNSPISYSSAARIQNVKFSIRNEKAAMKVATQAEPTISKEGNVTPQGNKSPQQTMEGNWVNITPKEAYAMVQRLLKDKSWSQVSFDPLRHSYFYDRATKRPVVAADDAIQIGRFVLAKNVEFAPREEFLYSANKGKSNIVVTPEARRIQDELTGKSFIEMAQWTVRNARNEAEKHFAQKGLNVIRALEKQGVEFTFEVQGGDSRNSRLYRAQGVASFLAGKDAKGTQIRIDLNGVPVLENQLGYPSGMNYETVLHEFMHTATRLQNRFLPATHPAVKELNSLFRTVVAEFNKQVRNKTLPESMMKVYKDQTNNLESPDELLAWGLEDRDFQKWLSTIKVGNKTAFDKIVEVVRRMLGISPEFESALDRLMKTTNEILDIDVQDIDTTMRAQGAQLGAPKPKAPAKPSKPQAPFQESLFKGASTPTSVGQQAMEILSGMGRDVKPPEPGYKEKIRQSWDNAKDNPKATATAARDGFRRFSDQVQTWAFSSDAALNNQIRREVMDSMLGQEEKIGLLLNTSLSQTFHSDAIANLFLRMGNVKYNKELHKWEGIEDKNNFITLSQKLDEIGAKYGLDKAQIELAAHTAFEAKRTKSLVEFNTNLDAQVQELRDAAAEERAKGNAVKASALSEKASSMREKEKFIHMDESQIRGGMTQFELMPELNQAVEIWNGIRGNAVDKLVESGLWTPDEAEFLLSNADYVPFFREDQLENGKGPKEFMRSLQVQAKERRLKGSDKPVNDIFDNMIRWTQYAVNRSVRNRSALSLATTAESVGLARKIKDAESKENLGVVGVDGDNKPIIGKVSGGAKAFNSLKQAAAANKELDGYEIVDFKDEEGNTKYFLTPDVSRENVVKVWDGGKQIEYSMEDPMFIEAFQGLESVSIPTIRWMAKMADILRSSVVLNPLFALSQIPQDSFAAMFSSGLKPQFALTIPFRAVKEFLQTLRGKSTAHEELKNFGVVGVRDFSSAMVRIDTEIAAGLRPAKGLWGNVKDKLTHFAMASDNAVRQATYTAALDQGLSKAEALEKAFEIFNVRRRGTSQFLSFAGQVIPFFNAYLAAQNVAYRTITGVGTSPTQRDAAYKVLFGTTASVFALSFLYAMMNGDDEDYLTKPTPTRDRLLMIPGTGMSIPLRADMYALPKVVAEHTYMLLTDKGFSDGAKFRASLKSLLATSILSPTPVPQAVKPLAEVLTNYDFFQQKPLVGTYQKKKEIERQFDDSTSELAKVIGRADVISPIAVDHLIRGVFGSAGGLVLYATNPFLWHVTSPNTPRPSISLRDALATIPNASGFVTKEYETGLKKDFFALKEEVDRAANTLTDLKQRNPEDIKDYIKDEKVRARLGLAPVVNQINSQLSTIRKSISTITNSTLPADVKEARIKQLRATEEKMLKGINLKKLRDMAQI